MAQTKRIGSMERRLERTTAAVKHLLEALDQYTEVQDDIQELETYYGSDLWKQDFDDDTQGRLPQDLKRGVLSEDAIWNLLSDIHEVKTQMLTLVTENQRQ